jgi:hypothetical protein
MLLQKFRCVLRKWPWVVHVAALLAPICLWTCPMWGSNTQSTDKAFNSHPWLEDFQQLLHEMSAHYGNLEWALRDRRMDLPRLRVETEEALQHAHSDAAAREILEHFTDAFGDDHLVIDWPNEDTQASTGTGNVGLCERLGYHVRGKAGLDYSLLPGLSPLPSQEVLFAGGLWRLSDSKAFGLRAPGDSMRCFARNSGVGQVKRRV